ncbi:hypothetical protein MHZ92_12660 [Sporosarcina sp. ACRSL]|uniref:hypothetical protein n=1 Tax=Sporosarcina sp. ACRSL TaxID=2918215 RepID=UPI001EF5435D|nr:hypothetical protein [Sporosarcina sp. ACRSL]MCG7344990.1 hypothetical protein [Sporosarcina sp. ACRSL]
MKKLQWNMKEVFFFPEDVGVPKDVRTLKVKAGFTEKRSEDAVRLSGIYHIAAKVDFTEGERIEQIPRDVVYVDDVEMDGQAGYFEYAVPLYIDLPPEVEHPLRIEATDVKGFFDGQGSFTVAWNVNCLYGQATPEQANKETEDSERVAQMEESKDKPTAAKETAAKEEATVADNLESEEVAKAANAPTGKAMADASETSKEAVATNEKADTATAMEVQKEPVKAKITQTAERQKTAPAPKRTAKEPVRETTATATHDSSSWNAQDDILSYIAALPDEWSSTRFRSNDIFVKTES